MQPVLKVVVITVQVTFGRQLSSLPSSDDFILMPMLGLCLKKLERKVHEATGIDFCLVDKGV
jgi:hypothetical protein